MSANMNAHNPTANRAGIGDFKWLKRSSDDLPDDMPLNIGQPEAASLERIGQLFVVNP
jgi:hypothetical protein